MNRDKGKFSAPAVGGSSLLVIFAVLCLTVFALLSLATVRADQRLSDASAQAVSGYYAADCRAEEVLALLRQGETPHDVAVRTQPIQNSAYIQRCEYAVPISPTQELRVTVELCGSKYRVLRWQAVPVGEWQPDEGIHVWDGES